MTRGRTTPPPPPPSRSPHPPRRVHAYVWVPTPCAIMLTRCCWRPPPPSPCRASLPAPCLPSQLPTGSHRAMSLWGQWCSNCGRSATAGRKLNLLGCAGCKGAQYCDKACQKHHWKHGGHKVGCSPPVQMTSTTFWTRFSSLASTPATNPHRVASATLPGVLR